MMDMVENVFGWLFEDKLALWVLSAGRPAGMGAVRETDVAGMTVEMTNHALDFIKERT